MSHVVDHLAHAMLRGFVYRVAWHTPWLVAGLLFVMACFWLARRRQW